MSNEGEKTQIVHSIDKRFVWFSGVIDKNSSCRVIDSLRKLSKTRGPVTFYISGRGGELERCFLIGEEIQNYTNALLGVAHGRLSSGCFLLTQFFKVCVSVKGASFGFHRSAMEATKKAQIEKETIWTQDFFRKELDRLRFFDGVQAAIFFKKMKDLDLVCEFFRSDKVLGVDHAIDLGLIDKISSRKKYFDDKEFRADRALAMTLLRKRYR